MVPLPPASIPQRPLGERDASRMLLLDRATGAWTDRNFRDFPDLLRGDELVALNSTGFCPRACLAIVRDFTHRSPAAIIRRATDFCERKSKSS